VTRRTLLSAICSTPLCFGAKADFERELERLRAKFSIPGLSAAIVRSGKLSWAAGLGLANRERNTPVTPRTPFRIASLTKTFASTLLMQLYEEGKLKLDEPVVRYIPTFQKLINVQIGEEVTIRHVLSHTSESKPPGERYTYSGARFAWLTGVIESLGGKPIRELLAERILDRVKMPRTVPGQDSTAKRYLETIADLATPYRLDKAGKLVEAEYPPKRISASAGILSTVEDLARYDAAIDGRQLIRTETQEMAWTPASTRAGETLPYALGWFVQTHRSERLVWHYGYWPGSYSALYLKVPQRGITLFLLANSDGLSQPFPSLGKGDVTGSEFAMLFLDSELRRLAG
jgi:CubicO group peptidase (beta-lactamase class C family)